MALKPASCSSLLLDSQVLKGSVATQMKGDAVPRHPAAGIPRLECNVETPRRRRPRGSCD